MTVSQGHRLSWPDGKDFAFTIFDDTDESFVGDVSKVYGLLEDLGFRTTKSVWPLAGSGSPEEHGSTCADPEYLDWVLQLQRSGFEIGLHNVSSCTSTRSETIAGVRTFRELFGHYPATFANHYQCREGIYWGQYRLSGLSRAAYNILTRFRKLSIGIGHMESSPLFWGDVCREKIQYVRNFVFGSTNTLQCCPFMPYFDPKRPFVNSWFASTEGRDVRYFNRALSDERQDQLEAQGGACIMYTHFGYEFVKEGVLDSTFRRQMTRLSKKNGWFVPVRTLLNYLVDQKGRTELTSSMRRSLEQRWLLEKVRRGTT